MSKAGVSIFDFTKINTSKLEYTNPKTIQGGNKSTYVYYRENYNKLNILYIRIPPLKTTHGICKNNSHYYIDLELDLNCNHS